MGREKALAEILPKKRQKWANVLAEWRFVNKVFSLRRSLQ